MQIAVLGAGSWGTALVKILQHKVNTKIKLHWYIRDRQLITYIQKNAHNARYLRSVKLQTQKIQLHNDIREAIAVADVIILAIPAAFLKASLPSPMPQLKDKLIVSAIKGMIPDQDSLISQYFIDHQYTTADNFLIVSGPCHAEEIAQERLSFLTLASPSAPKRETMQQLLASEYLATRQSTDVEGIEYATVLKNCYAIAAGLCHGLGYGDNYMAVLIANAMREMQLFLQVVAPRQRQILDSVYLGDLLVTAYSQFSRNRMLGNMLGKGYSLRSAQLEMGMIAEGYYATRSLYKIMQKHHLKLPVISGVYQLLYGGLSPKVVINQISEQLT